MYSVESGRVTDSIYAHDDAVSCISLKGDVLASGSWDSTVKVNPRLKPAEEISLKSHFINTSIIGLEIYSFGSRSRSVRIIY